MHLTKLLTVFALGLCLLSAPTLASAADEAKAPAQKMEMTKAGAAKAAMPEGMETMVMTIMPPMTDIVITLPMILVERGMVESVDAKAGTFMLKRKDGSMAKIMVNDHTMVENVYADVFHWESKKGIGDLKKGDRVRARVFPPMADGMETALLVDVFHL